MPLFAGCSPMDKEQLILLAKIVINIVVLLKWRINTEFLVRELRELSSPPPRNKTRPFLSQNYLETINLVTGRYLLFENISSDPSDVFDLFNNALDSRNRDSWKQLQQFECGSEELLNNAELYASRIASNLGKQGRHSRFSGNNIGLHIVYLKH